jgi:hypothetical protein
MKRVVLTIAACALATATLAAAPANAATLHAGAASTTTATAPTAPNAAFSVEIASNSDRTSYRFQGTGEPGAYVVLLDDGGMPSRIADVDASGRWGMDWWERGRWSGTVTLQYFLDDRMADSVPLDVDQMLPGA